MSARSRADAAFDAYIRLGLGRSLARLRDALAGQRGRPPSLRTLESWSVRYRWQERLREIEREARVQADCEHAEWVQQHRERLRNEGLVLQQRGLEWLRDKLSGDVSAHEAIRAMEAGFRLEALALGQATERIAVEEEYGNVIGRLSDDELERAIALLQSAAPGSAPGAGGAEPG